MPIEATIHTRLSGDSTLSTLVGGRFYPSQPSVDTTPPYLVYTVNSAETGNYTDGPSDLTRYSFTIDCWAVNASALWPVMDRVKTVLHGWRGASVQHTFQTSSSSDEQENGYHGRQEYTLWANTANVDTPPDATGGISAGLNTASMSACGHTLTLDCTGLHLDGEPIPAPPAGSSGSVQFNSNGTIAGGTDLTWDSSARTLQVTTDQDNPAVVVRYQNNGQGAILLRLQDSNDTDVLTIDQDGNVVATNFRGAFQGDGSLLAHLNANKLETGTVSDTLLSNNIPRKDGSNIFQGTNTFSSGPVTIIPGNTSSKGLIVQAVSSGQTANLVEVQDSGSVVRFKVDKDGNAYVNSSGSFSTLQLGPDLNHSVTLNFQNNSAGNPSINIHPQNLALDVVSQGLRLVQATTSAIQANFVSTGNTLFSVVTSSPALIAKGVASMTADLFQCQDSTGAIQFAVGKDGKLKTNQSSSGTTPGSVVKKLPVYEASGTLLGYIPIYDSIT